MRALEADHRGPERAEPYLERSERKKMVSPSAKRRAVKMSIEEGIGKGAAACRALGLARSSYYRRGRVSLESRRVRKEVIELSGKHPRYGYRRITALLRREGFEVNAKRIARIRREEGFKVSKKQRRMKRVGFSTSERRRATRPREVWSWDFVADQTENGSNFRILTLLDEHTRECLATHAAWSIRAVDVITVLESAIARYGAHPQRQRAGVYRLCDPGLAGGSRHQDHLHHARESEGTDRREIDCPEDSPEGEAKPNQNGHIESFHDKLRDECLNRELFGSLAEARVIVESWRVEYNDVRPHSSLGYLSPSEYKKINQTNGGCAPPNPAPLAAAGVRGDRGATAPMRQTNQTNRRTLVLKCPTCGIRSL